MSGRDPYERNWRAIQQRFQAVQRGLEALSEQIAELGGQVRRLSMSTRNDDQWVNDMHERETRYSNTILLLGYGGFFALWSSIHGKLPALIFGLIGLSMGVSILLFVGWELAKTIVIDKAIRDYRSLSRQGKRVDPRTLIDERIEAVSRFHLWAFVPSLAFGLSSGFSLLAFFIWHMSTH